MTKLEELMTAAILARDVYSDQEMYVSSIYPVWTNRQYIPCVTLGADYWDELADGREDIRENPVWGNPDTITRYFTEGGVIFTCEIPVPSRMEVDYEPEERN